MYNFYVEIKNTITVESLHFFQKVSVLISFVPKETLKIEDQQQTKESLGLKFEVDNHILLKV